MTRLDEIGLVAWRMVQCRSRLQTGEKVNTNTVEGYYSIFKRGMKGVYQHCDEKHLHRYLAELDFRYSLSFGGYPRP
jgi:ISXO2 transposase-like protein